MSTCHPFGGHSQRAFYAPAVDEQAVMNRGALNAGVVSPFTQTLSDIVPSDYIIRALVHSLLSSGGPSYVAIFIMTILVWIAVERVPRTWPTPHVFKKLLKSPQPKFNAATTIVMVIGYEGVCAAGFCSLPRFIFRGIGVAVSAPSSQLTLIAATRSCRSVFQVTARNLCDIAAFAFHKPMRLTSLPRIAQYGQSVKDLPGQVLKLAVSGKRFKNNVIFIVSHLANTPFVQYLARAVVGLNFLSRPASILPQMEGV